MSTKMLFGGLGEAGSDKVAGISGGQLVEASPGALFAGLYSNEEADNGSRGLMGGASGSGSLGSKPPSQMRSKAHSLLVGDGPAEARPIKAGSGGGGGGGDGTLPTLRRLGALRKQGGGTSTWGRKNWKTRFFVLEGARLLYFEDDEARLERKKPLNAQPYVLPFCDVLIDHSGDDGGFAADNDGDRGGGVAGKLRLSAGWDTSANKPRFFFSVKPGSSRGGKGPLMLEADSASSRAAWVRDLKRAQQLQAPP